MDDLLQKAIDFATEKHKGQKYGDKPYITHPLAVLERVKKRTQAAHILAATVLHDVVEDCDVSMETIHFTFGSTIRNTVDLLTRQPHESYAEYIRLLGMDHFATIIKIADLEENLSNNPPQRLKDKYELALLYLRN